MNRSRSTPALIPSLTLSNPPRASTDGDHDHDHDHSDALSVSTLSSSGSSPLDAEGRASLTGGADEALYQAAVAAAAASADARINAFPALPAAAAEGARKLYADAVGGAAGLVRRLLQPDLWGCVEVEQSLDSKTAFLTWLALGEEMGDEGTEAEEEAAGEVKDFLLGLAAEHLVMLVQCSPRGGLGHPTATAFQHKLRMDKAHAGALDAWLGLAWVGTLIEEAHRDGGSLLNALDMGADLLWIVMHQMDKAVTAGLTTYMRRQQQQQQQHHHHHHHHHHQISAPDHRREAASNQ